MLMQRILTACLLIPCVVAAVFFLPQPYYFGLTCFIVSLAAWEWAKLAGWKRTWQCYVYITCVLSALSFSVFFTDYVIQVGLCVWLLLAFYLLHLIVYTKLPTISRTVSSISGVFILTIFGTALTVLSNLNRSYLMWILLLVWLSDTLAYFAGSRFGKSLLAPTVSPRKTWEGLKVGILIPWLIMTPLLYCQRPWLAFFLTRNNSHAVFLSIILTLVILIAAVVGDLLESALKRASGLKDSGTLLPGHGGILDRLDSLLAALPIALIPIVLPLSF